MADRHESDSASQTAVAEVNRSIWAVNAEISARNGQAKDVATTKRNRRFVSAKAARLSEAADVARTAARQLAAAKARVLERYRQSRGSRLHCARRLFGNRSHVRKSEQPD